MICTGNFLQLDHHRCNGYTQSRCKFFTSKRVHMHTTIPVLFTTRIVRGYEPAGRYVPSSTNVRERLFVWAEYQDDATPMSVHDSAEKQAFLSHIEVYHLQSGTWEQQLARERLPLGAIGYACAAVEDDLYFFGG